MRSWHLQCLIWIVLLAGLLVSGCAKPRGTVVLMPDPDGRLGKAEVATVAGSQLLDKAGDLTQISGAAQPPSAPTTADPHYLAVTFADALAVTPLPPEKFTLFFETGTTTLVPQSKATLTAIIEAIKRRGALLISVSGHTDTSGSIRLNDRLAHDRAEAIQQQLVRNGVSPDRLLVSSHGKGNPLVPTPDGTPEPRNRRVEVIVR